MPFSLCIHNLKDNTIFVSDILKIIFASEKGKTEILSGHEPFFASLLPPEVIYQCTDKTQKSLVISENGFLKFEGSQCDVWTL